MNDVRKTTIEHLQQVLEKLFGEKPEINLEIPTDPSHGDYSCNIALVLSKKLGKNPRELAKAIKEELTASQVSGLQEIEKVEVAGPGFLNFFLSNSALESNLSLILQEEENYGHSNVLQNVRIMVEFTDPNPLKEFHIGHLYSNAVGESISRLLESQGAEVLRACYQGDVGMHVAKAIFGIMNHKLKIKDLENSPLSERARFLGESYALGAKLFEENEAHKEEVQRINKSIYEKDPEVFALYEMAKAWSLEYFEEIYKRLGTHFDKYYFESNAGKLGLQIVHENIPEIFLEEGGAVIFPKEKSGLHTRVFINSQGFPTYEAKELGLAPQKYEDFAYDQSIIVTGNEINEYFKVLLKALSLIRPDLASKTRHISHGMVRLPSGKMSSRTGVVITGEWLLDETKAALKKAHPEMQDVVAEALTVGAVKYALLKVGIGSDLTFSFEESINLHGNSGPYVQYAYARTQSVVSKSQVGSRKSQKLELRSANNEELELLRALVHFPEVAQDAAEKFAPSGVATYLFDLAQKFSVFYEKHKVIGSEHEEFRLVLVNGVGHVLKNGLQLLGIPAPQKI